MLGKRFAIVAVSTPVLCFLAQSGCARKSPPEPGRYYSKEKGFSIRLPKEWERKEGFMGTTIMGLSPQEGPADEFRENVNVFVEELPKALSLEEYSSLSLANLRKLMTDFQEHETSQTTVGDAGASRLVSSHRMGQYDLKVLVYWLIKARRAYVITCSAEREQFDAYLGKFEDIVKSFRFE